ncbi:hypothetical protein [Gluconacetobacter sacchari]|uniref:hypothetical protein n=1 Tax=Gluconacetobacter sacchari TaxID=92759 RepID=UPI0039B3EDBD
MITALFVKRRSLDSIGDEASSKGIPQALAAAIADLQSGEMSYAVSAKHAGAPLYRPRFLRHLVEA